MPRGGCTACATPGPELLFDRGRSAGSSQNFAGNFLSFFRIEIHRQIDAFAFDVNAHHALIGRADLHVRLNVAFAVDTHGCAFQMLGLVSHKTLERQAGAGQAQAMADTTIREFRASDTDWLVEQHGTQYAEAEGFDDTFGPLVASILDAFNADHDSTCERGWIAEENGKRLGSVFCVRLNEDTAKLRLFLLTPQARGKGLGRILLAHCMGFAQRAGYAGMQLWTHESHRAACALYAKTGWQLTDSKPVHSFGCDLVEQTWVIRFGSPLQS